MSPTSLINSVTYNAASGVTSKDKISRQIYDRIDILVFLRWFQEATHIRRNTNIDANTINKCFPCGTFGDSKKLRLLVDDKFNTKI